MMLPTLFDASSVKHTHAFCKWGTVLFRPCLRGRANVIAGAALDVLRLAINLAIDINLAIKCNSAG